MLVIDDDREQQFNARFAAIGINDITHVKTAQEGIQKLSIETYDLIFLDYDLTYMEVDKPSTDNNGVAVARWLADHKMNTNHKARIIIHSPDPYGSQYMKELLPSALVIPGVWLDDQFKGLIQKLKLGQS